MIITAEEYRAMGFTAEDDEVLENCLKRADFVLDSLTAGKASAMAEKGGKPAQYVKQAAAFQTSSMVRAEELISTGNKSEERVSLGDYSYTSVNSSEEDVIEPVDTNVTVIRLLRAAGCLFGGLEARE